MRSRIQQAYIYLSETQMNTHIDMLDSFIGTNDIEIHKKKKFFGIHGFKYLCISE